MTFRAKSLLGLVIIVLAISSAVAVFSFRSRSLGPRPFCHKILTGILIQREMEHRAKGDMSGAYPNVGGGSEKSMIEIASYFPSPAKDGATEMLRQYAFVPGLQESDPENLILMYLKQQTRYTWHGDTRANRNKLMWIVFSPGLDSPFDTDEWCPEGARKLNTREFKARLQATLDYLKANNRPYWTNTVREHSAFLNSIKE